MSTQRIHRAVSADGTEIAGRVVGRGPGLVLLHGASYCGETAWQMMLPHLTDRFTCFLPSTRGRGLSADAAEHSPEWWLEDVVAFIESLGQPVAVFGWSGGAMLAISAAARCRAVTAVVAYEPATFETLDEETFGAMRDTLTRMAAEVEQGRAADAARRWSAFVCTEDELAVLIAKRRHEVAAVNMPADLRMFQQLDPERSSPSNPAVLATVAAPVLVLQGERTARSWFERSSAYLSTHLPNGEVRVIPGAGHGAPGIVPEAIVAELVDFLGTVREPAGPT